MNAMNKLISKKIFVKHKITTPKYEVINKRNYVFKNLKRAIKIKKLEYPMVIKPNNEGSSIGVKICKNFISLKKYKYSIKYLRYIDNRELYWRARNSSCSFKW